MRKHFLLGTTALLAGAVAMPDYVSAEEPLRLQVRGYKNEFFAVGDVDSDVTGVDFGNTSEFSDGEVHFRGDTTLDNGLTIGVQIELEAIGATSDDIDEAYTTIDGDFGRLVIGSENLASYTAFWATTAPSVGIPINSGWITAFVPQPSGSTLGFRSPGLTTNATLTNDTFQISYLSPRFGGFQFVAGYAPTDAVSGDPKNGVTDEEDEIHNIFGVGLNFSQSFNSLDFGAAVGYERGEQSNQSDDAGGDDPQIIKAGVSLGFAGFTIAGSYASEFDGRSRTATGEGEAIVVSNVGNTGLIFQDLNNDGEIDFSPGTVTTTSSEGQSWDAGISYATGPWGISATYFHGEEEGSVDVAGDDEVDAYVGAISYALGPGITTSLSVLYGKFDNEDGVESEATMGILGLAVKF